MKNINSPMNQRASAFWKSFLMLFVFWLSIGVNANAQTDVTLGSTGTDVPYEFPNNFNYDYSYTQTIYSASELMGQGAPGPGYINKIRYYSNYAVSTADWQDWVIYMANTAQVGFVDVTNFIPVASMTQVFNGTTPANTLAGGWVEITLSTPFLWDGTSNLVVAVDENTGSYGFDSPDWKGYTMAPPTNFKGIYFYQDGTDIDPNAPSATYSNAVNMVASIQFEMTYSSPCTSPPTAGTVNASSNPICPSVPNSFSITGGTNGLGQTMQWQSSPSGLPGTFTNILGATGSNYTGSQTADTYYRCVATCSGLSDTTAALLVTTSTFQNCYCTSSAAYASDEDIFNVTIGTLNNSSTCSTTGGGASVQGQYADYTALPQTTLNRSLAYPFSVEIGGCSGAYDNMIKIFIDYNQNGSFSDPGEEVYASLASTNGTHIETGTITIPLTAALGTTRMRVINVETTDINEITPCSTIYGWGETEDYLVTIGAVPPCLPPTAFALNNADNTSASFGWTSSASQWQFEYGAPGFTQGTGTLVLAPTNPDTLTGLTPNQLYSVYVRAICAPGDTSPWTGPVNFNTFNIGQYMDWNSDCPSTGFVDISATGTFYNIADDDEAAFTLPFSFYYQGTLVSDITIGNNGAIALGTTVAQVSNSNGTMASAANGMYPFWEDLATSGPGIWSQINGTAPNRKVIIQWNKDRYAYTGNPLNFELIIDEATGEIYFVYDDVTMGSASYDYGLSATIGVAGPAQDLQVSYNNATYLQNNSCVKFYYTDCPKPTNFTAGTLTQTDFSFTWTAGMSNETQWIVEYGPAGFTPGTGTIMNETATSSAISGLTQLTDYTVYIYANCANGDTSLAISYNFTTLPFCSAPTGIGGTTLPDTMKLTWNWTASSGFFPIQSFNIQYGMTGFGLYSSNATIVPANGINFADTVANPALIGSGVYQVYIQAVCSATDTSGYAGPFTIVMPRTNDDVCQQELLQLNTTYTLNNQGATVASGENAIAPPATGAQTNNGWASSTMTGTLWYTFVAPASGQVRVNATGIANYNGKAGVYSATNCANFATFSMISANDNDITGSSVAPNFTACGLTPGQTYYILFDRVSAAGNFSLHISSVSVEAGTVNSAVTNVCSGDTVNLNNTITTANNTGYWYSPIPAVNVNIDGPLFNSAGLAYQAFNIEYRVTDGCAYDSIISVVKIFKPSSAGQDGTITACKNQPINLISGLSGNIDLGGQWYDPTQAPVSSSVTTSNFPGQYNYKYVVTNGVCPNDTALLVITVQSTCNWLSLEETALEDAAIYPNPTTGIINIDAPVNGMKLEVTDINGRLVEQVAGTIPAGTSTISLKDVERGTYFFKLTNGGSSKVFRIVIQ